MNGGPLTPPTSSGAEDTPFSFNPAVADLRALREYLNQARLHSKTINQKLQYGLELVSTKFIENFFKILIYEILIYL